MFKMFFKCTIDVKQNLILIAGLYTANFLVAKIATIS